MAGPEVNGVVGVGEVGGGGNQKQEVRGYLSTRWTNEELDVVFVPAPAQAHCVDAGFRGGPGSPTRNRPPTRRRRDRRRGNGPPRTVPDPDSSRESRPVHRRPGTARVGRLWRTPWRPCGERSSKPSVAMPREKSHHPTTRESSGLRASSASESRTPRMSRGASSRPLKVRSAKRRPGDGRTPFAGSQERRAEEVPRPRSAAATVGHPESGPEAPGSA